MFSSKSEAPENEDPLVLLPNLSRSRGTTSSGRNSADVNLIHEEQSITSPSILSKRSVETGFLASRDINIPTLSIKDVMLILVEVLMAYGGYVIRQRKSEAHSYHAQLWKTKREIEIDLLLMQGWAALGSLLSGYVADAFVGSYYVAFFNIMVIFILTSFLVIEQLLMSRLRSNPYNEVFTHVASVGTLIIHSTGFSRVVFGLEHKRNKKPSAISLFLFLLALGGDLPTSGGLLMAIASGANLDTFTRVALGWWMSGISLILYYTFFKSISLERPFLNAARKTVKCAVDVCWHMVVDWTKRRDWKDHVLRHYDRPTIQRVKGLYHLAILICPTLGFIFMTVGKVENLFHGILKVVIPSGPHIYTGITNGLAITVICVMLVTYFLLIPGLSYTGLNFKQFNYQFSLGYLFGLCAMYYMAVVLKANEPFDYNSGIGYIRIYNSLRAPVKFTFLEERTLVHHVIPPHSSIMGAYVISEHSELIEATIEFDQNTNLTTFMQLASKKCFGYAVVVPPELVRVQGEIPLFEGPPQTNDYTKPRLYIYCGTKALKQKNVMFRDLASGEWVITFTVPMGKTVIFQIPPGEYEIWVQGTELHLYKQFHEGGLYGILMLADLTASLLELDTILDKKDAGSFILTGFSVFSGMSLALAYVALQAVTYTKAPSGLLCISFGYLSFQENLAVWVLVFGYYTWHGHVSGTALVIYSLALTILYFICVFIMVKYRKYYV